MVINRDGNHKVILFFRQSAAIIKSKKLKILICLLIPGVTEKMHLCTGRNRAKCLSKIRIPP
ncbi:MAG TPA: hypothetical protein DCG73_08195 [Morganella sp. (in: Bacteria)]|nr:hypothetical protein [Morganella sp. (in: enterobacteria)]